MLIWAYLPWCQHQPSIHGQFSQETVVPKELALRYGLEFVVIVLGVFISFHVQEVQDESADRVMKNEALEQLVRVMQDDLSRLSRLWPCNRNPQACQRFWTKVELGRPRGFGHGLPVSRGRRSVLFPQEGVFNQIVSSDLVELIENHELKSGLFRLYNEDLRRHAVTRSSTTNSSCRSTGA